MRIIDLFGKPERPVFSFEFFPPQTEEGRNALLQTIAELAPLEPGFVSVTYGAGGSTRDRTLELVAHIKHNLAIEAMAHLTCVGASRADLTAVLDRLEAASIENLIALRGDPPRGQTDFVPHPDGLAHASDLLVFLRSQQRPFCLAAAGYPETHVEAASAESDLGYLLAKVQAGAEVIITQLFFDNRAYFAFVGRARRAGIRTPIVPGIMPITNVGQIERFTKLCGASIPIELRDKLAPIRDDGEAVVALGIEYAAAQCEELLLRGAPGIHFYTLNRSRSARDVLTRLKTTEAWRKRAVPR
jgi:methylenetetrahydrofolate reductase (NADH)